MPLPIVEALKFPVESHKRLRLCLIPGTFLLFLPGLNLFFIGYITSWFYSLLLEKEREFPSWSTAPPSAGSSALPALPGSTRSARSTISSIWNYFKQGMRIGVLSFVFFFLPPFLLLLGGIPTAIRLFGNNSWDQMLMQALGGAFWGIFFLSAAIFLFCAAWFLFPMALIRFLEGEEWLSAFSIRQIWEDIRQCLADYLAVHIIIVICLFFTLLVIWIVSALLLFIPFGEKIIPYFAWLILSFGTVYSIVVGSYLFAETYLGFLYDRLSGSMEE